MTAYLTDERLKGYLDTNQLSRERLGLAVLALDRRYSALKPRHPRGGPDGGRDIEGRFEGELVFGAVGFQSQATDADEDRKAALKKFSSDLDAALGTEPAPEVFVFLTNVNLRQGGKDAAILEAQASGLVHAEIFDRERIRIPLDTPEGFAARFQYLGLTLSEAEQAAFFARWGDDLQPLLTDGFGRLEGALRRLQFLQEAKAAVETLWVRLELDREYSGEEIGHLRAFCHLFFKNPKRGLFRLRFGVADNISRLEAKTVEELDPDAAGAAKGLIGPQWEQRFSRAFLAAAEAEIDSREEKDDKWRRLGGYTSIGFKSGKVIGLEFSQDSFINLGPRFTIEDLDDAMFALFVNRPLAEKIANIQVFTNAYKLAEYGRDDFRIDAPTAGFKTGLVFTEVELAGRWARIMSRRESGFRFRFDQETPSRFYTPRETVLAQPPTRLPARRG